MKIMVDALFEDAQQGTHNWDVTTLRMASIEVRISPQMSNLTRYEISYKM